MSLFITSYVIYAGWRLDPFRSQGIRLQKVDEFLPDGKIIRKRGRIDVYGDHQNKDQDKDAGSFHVSFFLPQTNDKVHWRGCLKSKK